MPPDVIARQTFLDVMHGGDRVTDEEPGLGSHDVRLQQRHRLRSALGERKELFRYGGSPVDVALVHGDVPRAAQDRNQSSGSSTSWQSSPARA